MGKRGPAPTPSAVLKLRGSWRADANKAEPKPKAGKPVCPKWLDKNAKAAWRQLVPQLADMGVLTKIDGQALALLCQTWGKWRKAEEMIAKHGEVYPIKNDAGEVKYLQQSPYVSIARSAADQLSRLFREFGMTPSARTRIEVPEQSNKEDDKRGFLAI
tara:strand:+ start:1177 stop:1653 length:477 start_codon:yes stop_codon:yes gene_type:complete